MMAALAWLQDQTLSRLSERHHSMETIIASLAKRDDCSDSDEQTDTKDDGELSPGSGDPLHIPGKDKRKR